MYIVGGSKRKGRASKSQSHREIISLSIRYSSFNFLFFRFYLFNIFIIYSSVSLSSTVLERFYYFF